MMPILITAAVTAPIIGLGTYLYLRRHSLSAGMRITLMWVLFLFILLSWPTVLGILYLGSETEMLKFARPVAKFTFLWIVGVITSSVQLYRLCRYKGDIWP